MRPSLRMVRSVALSLLFLSCATDSAVGPTLSPNGGRRAFAAVPSPAKVVISQLYGAGGNGGAAYNHDYIELFNAGGTDQVLTGWSIQYASATGTGNFGVSGQIIPLTGSIAPGEYVLVEGAGGATGAAVVGDIRPLPPVTPINMAAAAGKVALVSSTASLGCNGGSAPCSPAALALIVDLVGYGTANFYEGAAAPAASAANAVFRKDHGCTDTNNNAADFTAAAAAPRTR
ncbi:MAG: lamin tail domain-containing protein, partial [Gemmatimonadaceae bacterium]